MAVHHPSAFQGTPILSADIHMSVAGVRIAVFSDAVLASLQDIQRLLGYSVSTSASSRFRALFRNNRKDIDAYLTKVAAGPSATWFINEDGLRELCNILNEDRAQTLTHWLNAGGISNTQTQELARASAPAFTPLKLVHSTATTAPPDPIQLHTRAMNSLGRCQRELRAESPCYGAALAHLDMAQQAMAALEAIETSFQH